MPWFYKTSLAMPVCRYFVRQRLKRSGLISHESSKKERRGARIGILYIRTAEIFTIRVVPEYLVAYRQKSSGMSCNAEGMTGSFAVTMRRVRERHDDLPAATFRWSDGYFYLYLAYKCYDSRDYPRCSAT